jgi:rhodanese-related sulfurtransferase
VDFTDATVVARPDRVVQQRQHEQGATHESSGCPGHGGLGPEEPGTDGIVFLEVDEDTTAYNRGHLPGAINIPWNTAANEDGTFKSDDPALYRDQGLGTGSPAIIYCRIGERSAHTWVVLHELLGNPDVKNYDGSWTEYGSLIGVPVALGDGR